MPWDFRQGKTRHHLNGRDRTMDVTSAFTRLRAPALARLARSCGSMVSIPGEFGPYGKREDQGRNAAVGQKRVVGQFDYFRS